MPVFDTLGISGSGLLVHRKWLDAVSDNISNVNTVTRTNEDAFRERFVVAQSVDYGSGEGGGRGAPGRVRRRRGPHGLRAGPPARRRRGLRQVPGRRPRGPDDPAADGAARLPG